MGTGVGAGVGSCVGVGAAVGAGVGVGSASSHANMEAVSRTSAIRAKAGIARETILILLILLSSHVREECVSHSLAYLPMRRRYIERVNCITKVLDFVQLGGPVLAVGSAIFEMRVG